MKSAKRKKHIYSSIGMTDSTIETEPIELGTQPERRNLGVCKKYRSRSLRMSCYVSLFLSYIIWHQSSGSFSKSCLHTCVDETDDVGKLSRQIPSLLDVHPVSRFIISDKQRKKLAHLRVLIIGFHCYGNVGDDMETTPLIGNLYRWGVGTIDAVPSGYSWEMKKNWYPRPRHSAQWISKVYGEKERVDYRIYDFVIHAPGPTFVMMPTLEKICTAGTPFMAIGFSMGKKGNVHSFPQSICKCIRLVTFREYVSYNSEMADFIRNVCKKPVLFSGDLSFSYVDFFNYSRYYYFQEQYLDGNGFEAGIFFRPTKNSAWDLTWRDTTHGPSKRKTLSQICIFNHAYPDMVWPLSIQNTSKLAFATTDIIVDRSMMQRLKKIWPSISQVHIKSVEQLWAFISNSNSVYTTRYHPGIATKILGSHLIVLPILGSYKMDGLVGLKSIPSSVVRKHNDETLQRVIEVMVSG